MMSPHCLNLSEGGVVGGNCTLYLGASAGQWQLCQFDWGSNSEMLSMGATKYDWRSKLKEAVEPTAKPAPPPPQVIGDDKFDWGLKEATKIVEYLTDRDTKCDWTFKETINSAIALVESEEKAQREREAAEKALLDRAGKKRC